MKTRLVTFGWNALLAAAIIAAGLVFKNPEAQALNWSFPYFSGAANMDTLGEWRISPSDYAAVRDLTPAEYREYRHQASDETIAYSFNNYGYVLVVAAARTLFSWMGEANAVVALQMAMHVILSLTVVALLVGRVPRIAFILLFAINPVVLRFVTFPYYYFWTVVPCALLAIVWLRRERVGSWIVPIALALYLSYLVRPPVLFVCLLIFAVAFRPGQRIVTLAAAAVFALLVLFVNVQTYSSPWHTAYVGVGAYSNPFGINGPFDENGYSYYKSVTGVQVDTNPMNGSFQTAAARDDYWRVLRARYLEIAKDKPLLLARNAALNTAEAFALGYDANRRWVTLASAAAGLIMIILIVISRAWIWGIGIFCYAAAFTPYFPPIPAYLFGAYFLTALAVGQVADFLIDWLKRRQAAGRRVPEPPVAP
jgi:hypothetical protein